jgi:hypothetical protein
MIRPKNSSPSDYYLFSALKQTLALTNSKKIARREICDSMADKRGHGLTSRAKRRVPPCYDKCLSLWPGLCGKAVGDLRY